MDGIRAGAGTADQVRKSGKALAGCRLLLLSLPLIACEGSRPPEGASLDGPGSAGRDAPVPAALAELPCIDSERLSGMHSSFARDGTNVDFLLVGGYLPSQRPYLYRDEAGRYVLLDVTGPGVIKRLWMTQLAVDLSAPDVSQGPLMEHGRIQFFFDGKSEPSIDMPAETFFAGETAPFLGPLCGDHAVSSGGNYCSLRLPFAERAVIAVTGRPNYWNIEYDRLPSGRDVQSFDPSSAQSVAALDKDRAVLERAGSDPRILSAGNTTEGRLALPPDHQELVFQRSGAGVIQAVEIRLSGEATISDLWLEANWDQAVEPQLRAPLGDLFLSGRGERQDARGLLAGFMVNERRGYLYFPMPFRDGAELRLINSSPRSALLDWRIVETADTALAKRADCGRLHASYTPPHETVTGQDDILLDVQGRGGKVVGLSLNVDGPVYPGGLTTFLEGDERVHIDGSQSPQIYGTGMEDIFNGGFYYIHGPFTLPTHGVSAEEATDRGHGVAQYRVMVFDPWTFRDSIRIGVEHGGGNGVPTENSSLVYWYGLPKSIMTLSDEVDVGQEGSEQEHEYVSADAPALSLSAYYSGDRDGNISNELFDRVIVPGAIPALNPEELVTDTGRYHAIGTQIRLRLNVDPQNRGVLLRRRLDAILFDQRARVLVDGVEAGIWHWPLVNSSKRWADHDFLLPEPLTLGKSELALTLEILPPVRTPAITGLTLDDLLTSHVSLPSVGIFNRGGWSDFRYQAFSLLDP